MYCTYKNGECSTSFYCLICPHYINGKNPSQYNYKCSCGGEFLQPVYKWITYFYENSSSGEWVYVCPFCNKKMEGMNG